MKQIVFSMIVLAIMVALLAGCEPNFETKGREVKFTATSKGGIVTKTSYSGESGNYAIIGWGKNDQIRIYSPNEDFIMNHDGQIYTGTGIEGADYNYVYADYGLTDITLEDGHYSKAKLSNILLDEQGHTSSLYWKTSAEGATFYGVYPTTTGINWFNRGGLAFDIVAPKTQNVTFSDEGVHTPDISSLPLLAMQQVSNGDAVDLSFYPAFTALEFNLKSKEGEITLHSFMLKINDDEGETWENGYLTGKCIYAPALEKKEGDPFYILNNKIYYYNSLTGSEAEICEKELNVAFPEGTTIDTDKDVTFTLFALPNDLNKVSITIALTADGVDKVRTLNLQQKKTSDGPYEWLPLNAGHKARFKAVAVDKGATWRIFYDVSVNEWVPLDPTQVII